MKTRAERFLKAREHSGLTQAQVADKVGVLQQTVNKIETGIIKNPRNPEKFGKVYNSPTGWLMHGTGTPPLWAIKETNQIPENYLPILEWNEIEEWLKNGTKNLVMNEKTRDFLPSPLIDQPHRNKLFALRVKNDSMVSPFPGALSFNQGSILVAEPVLKCKSGDYVIIRKRHQEEAIFRQIIKDGDNLLLKPINPQFHIENLDDDILPLALVLSKTDILI